jgi:hypothetical protein
MYDPPRLRRELDILRRHGVTCIRIVAASEGEDDAPLQVVPTLQPRPGVWNEKLAVGMDLVLHELRRRRMRAIMTLSNQWSWSGGFATFLVWAVRAHTDKRTQIVAHRLSHTDRRTQTGAHRQAHTDRRTQTGAHRQARGH